MSSELEQETRFLFNSVVEKLNAKRTGDPSIDDDETYASHMQEESEERTEFLKTATPAFFLALKKELQSIIDALNSKLRASADRLQLHVNQRMMRDLLITSNVSATEWFNNGISIEITTIPSTGEVVETHRGPNSSNDSERDVCLFSDIDGSLRIANDKRSFSVNEYAMHLIETFLEEREALTEEGEEEDEEADDE